MNDILSAVEIDALFDQVSSLQNAQAPADHRETVTEFHTQQPEV
jgi:flagellar motor switch protein FliM